MVCVDHNRNTDELEYLSKQNNLIVVEDKAVNNTHGDGLDCASKWAKQNGYDSIIFVEPDCVFTGRAWYDNLIDAIGSGHSMAATYKWDFGPYHPCGTAWVLDDIPGSFNIGPRTTEEINHPNFVKYINLNRLIERCMDEKQPNLSVFYSVYHWDCGTKNWFQLAMRNKDALVDGDGLIHFWSSRECSPQKRARENGYYAKLLSPYLPKKLMI
jgi:hypothetical protein